MAQKMSFYLYFQYPNETQFHPKRHLRSSYIYMTGCLPREVISFLLETEFQYDRNMIP